MPPKGDGMSRKSRWDDLNAIYPRYQQADGATRRQMVDEVCAIGGDHRQYAIRLLNGAPPQRSSPGHRKRAATYGPDVVAILVAIWEAAGYPWSTRLNALIPLWLPWVRLRVALTPVLEHPLLAISPRTMDDQLRSKKRLLATARYGRTQPGPLLKHHIPIKTDHWDVTTPGFPEVDLVSPSGPAADGEFIHSLNQTDIHTTWVDTRAVLGNGQERVQAALEDLRTALPFPLLGIDSDHGSECINDHL